MDAELRRANSLIAANRRLQSAISALLAAQSVEELDRKIIDVLPGAIGYERAATLRLPSAQQPAQIVHALGYPQLDLSAIPRSSPLAAGEALDVLLTGTEDDDDAPHGDVRGSFVLAPLRERGRVVEMVYADTLRDEVIPADAAGGVAYALDVAGVVRANLSLARTDALTTLPNRRVFEERLEGELLRSARSRRPFGLAILDLDYFKEINDTYGHPAGDEALREFAATLRSRARQVDFVARFAGDEFAMLILDIDHRAARAIVERVLEAIRQVNLSVPARLSASAGVALSYPVDTAETLVERADSALYDAKQSGRDCAKIA